MKRFITIAAFFAALLISFEAQAQLTISAGYAGETVSIDTLATGKHGTHYFDGFSFGLNWRFALTSNIDLSVGARYRSCIRTESKHYLMDTTFTHFDLKERQNSVDVPVLLYYNIPIGKVSLCPFVGPMMSFATSGSTHTEWTYPYNTQSTVEWYENNGPRKRFNVYAMAGLNARFGHVNLMGCYRYGLLELSNREAFSIKTSGFTVAVGYEF